MAIFHYGKYFVGAIVVALSFCLENLALAQDADERPFRVFQPDIAPWGDKDSRDGFIVKIVETAFERAGVDHKVVYAPWKREQAAVQQRGYAFMAPLTRLQKREPLYQWIAPVNVSYLQLVTPNPVLAKLDIPDLIDLPIAARLESPAQYTSEHLGFKAITLVENEEVAARLMRASRVTLWMQRGLPGGWAYWKAGGDNGDLHIVKRWTTPEQYLVASLDVPHPVIHKLRTVLDEMRLSGEMDKIKQSYFDAPLDCELLLACISSEE